ncbi:HAD-IIIC family phosphatase [Luteimonas sp. MC1825]|uniref:HAD-IIIC family phosphatase n=1 Tax=Luteimonas sp. MC1825 TaxID=2761107 RepID=UPI0016103842|nr:HAD-IIIC family phosphatase [Luteimonas sp. MC1825]MBB6598143.1 HAD-IIIC family phosphatase [Luteimonas sp. MC1825]QOC88375.1 HAD-IIIC family phosphatase [Luteimonas sp. MC1825]
MSGTWTLDPLAPVVGYWFDLLHVDADVRLAPYAQVFQQLLDPDSTLRRNHAGANVVCLRWEDLLPHGNATGADTPALLAARIDELHAAITVLPHHVPCLVVVGPGDAANRVFNEATRALSARLAGIPEVHVQDGADAMARYRVGRVQDAASDRFGHVPYTGDALVALGTAIARWYAARVRPPIKLFAVDADHTLWSGVVGEQGVDGLRVDPGHLALQRALAAQAGAGALLGLLSKNEEADLRAVFTQRHDLALGWQDFIAHRVDWNPKPDHLRDIAAALGIGLDSVVFLDDNPLECAQMRAASPSTLTVRVPEDPQRLEAFVEHLWLFDRHAVTAEDRDRAAMYRDNAARADVLRGTTSLQAFLDGLELVVDIDPPRPGDLPRLSQLTRRTNQFNASLLRLQEGELAATGAHAFHRGVRARDRFGDYGLVGQLRASPQGGCLLVDLFMLSCRALGRGIEHRMLAAAGAHAQALGLAEVAVRFTAGERNTPVRRFLETAFSTAADGDACVFRMPASQAAAVAFDASATDNGDIDDGAPVAAALSVPAANAARDGGAVYEHIAHHLATAADIGRAIAARSQPRPALATGFIAPAPGLEHAIAAIWREVLRIDAAGAQDPFRELGGKSIHLVQVHRLLLERLGIDVDITTLFQHPTVASLAAHLSTRSAPAGVDAAQQRGRRMREAHARAALLAAARKHRLGNGEPA